MSPIPKQANGPVGIVIGKRCREKLQADILPGHAKRVENPPGDRKAGQGIVEKIDADFSETTTLNLPKYADIEDGDCRNPEIPLPWLEFCAGIIPGESERQKAYRRFL